MTGSVMRTQPYGWEIAELLGRIAKETGCVGIILDTEQYGGGDRGAWMAPFSYTGYSAIAASNVSLYGEVKSFDECAAMVRERGRQWVKAITKHYPDIKILSLLGCSFAGHKFGNTLGKALQQHRVQ